MALNQRAVYGEKGVGNMKSLNKVAAVMLAASVLLSMAACGKKKEGSHSGQKISSNSPWYDVTAYDVDQGLAPDKEVESGYTQLCGFDDDYVVVNTQGNYKRPDDFNWEKDDFTAYQLSSLSILDRKTKSTIKAIDLYKLFSGSDYVESVSYMDGKIYLTVSGFDMETYEQTKKKVIMDVKTQEILDTIELEGGDASTIGNYKVGKYNIETLGDWSEDNARYYLNVTSPDGESKKIEVTDEANKVDYIESVIPLSDKMALVSTYVTGAAGLKFFELDLTTMTLTAADKGEYDWLDTLGMYRMKGTSDGKIYNMTSVGISIVDFKKKVEESVLNFSWCSCDRNLFSNLQIADANNGEYLLYGEKSGAQPYGHNFYMGNGEFILIELKQAPKNPHAGKTILELYTSYGYLSEEISKAVLKFNDTNAEYFIEVTDRYSNEVDYDSSNIQNADDSAAAGLKYMANMSNKLAMDIMNGDGPDMLLNIDYYNQLRNDNYLMDLTPLVSNMSNDKYFTNVLDVSKVDGKLYNVPISFGVAGIQTDPKYAPTTGIGFTTDEYSKFVKDALNGTDVISNGQAQYFGSLFSNMTNVFIKNGKADFSSPEFAALAEYVKDNVPEKSTEEWNNVEEVYTDGNPAEEIKPAVYSSIGSYYDYFSNIETTNGCANILGLPSSDGRGPTIFAYDSLAISAQSKYKDACVEFIKVLISDDTQKELAAKGYFVLNRDAFHEVGLKAADYFNSVSLQFPYGYWGEGEKPKNKVKFTKDHIATLEKTIESCSAHSSEDAAITIILVEEMPAYFSGQKDLNEVIKIAQDRVQKVLDERK